MKIEINLKIILFGILFFILKQIDIYLIFIIFITFHETAHLVIGMLLRTQTARFFYKSVGAFNRILFIQGKKKL